MVFTLDDILFIPGSCLCETDLVRVARLVYPGFWSLVKSEVRPFYWLTDDEF